VGGHVSRRHALSYARVIRTPGVLPALLSVYAGALPFGILNLALLLLAKQRTGSIEVGGIVIAAFGLGNAVGLIVQGGSWTAAPLDGRSAAQVSCAQACSPHPHFVHRRECRLLSTSP
jgi:sulfite exporter TauE/SafE